MVCLWDFEGSSTSAKLLQSQTRLVCVCAEEDVLFVRRTFSYISIFGGELIQIHQSHTSTTSLQTEAPVIGWRHLWDSNSQSQDARVNNFLLLITGAKKTNELASTNVHANLHASGLS